jgi:molybdopterin-synthase adenylyltransferase
MSKLIFQNQASQKFWSDMLSSTSETASIILARAVQLEPNDYRLLVAETVYVPQEAYEKRTTDLIVIHPEFLATVFKKARHQKYSVIMTHTHPWAEQVSASAVDIEGEQLLLPTLFRRVPDVPHGRLILGQRTFDAMLCLAPKGERLPLELFDVGRSIKRVTNGPTQVSVNESFDRQVRAFGYEGQKKIESLRVGIVGLGGTGSLVAQQLAHLGCKDFLLLDTDLLEATNLNRVVGATHGDIGRPKVDIIAELVRRIRPAAKIEAVHSSVLVASVARKLVSTDLFFCCTDTQGSRAVLTQLAYQYLVPAFDLGVQIEAKNGSVSHITGRVQMLAPGLACLVCSDLLDADAVRRDLMTEAQRRADPYIVGRNETQPAVISLNGTVASLAVTMYLSAVTGIPVTARHQVYRAELGIVRSIQNEQVPNCVICSRKGAFGQGDNWVPPGRPA